jgi:hypothetical protein
MSSIPPTLELDQIAALNKLGSGSLGVDGLLDDFFPPEDAASYPSDGSVQQIKADGPVVEMSGVPPPAQTKNHVGFQLPIQDYSMAADLAASDPRLEFHTYDTSSIDGTPPPLPSAPTQPKKQRSSKSTVATAATNKESKKEAQRRYREKNRQKQQQQKLELETSLAKAHEEMEVLMREQEQLYSEYTVLQGMIDYKNSMLASARNALGNFSAAGSIIYSVACEIQHALWNKLTNASDDQIVAYSKSETALRSLNRVFFNLVTSTLNEWGRATTPASRDHIERKLGCYLAVRHRAVQKTWATDPLRVSRVMHNPPVDDDSLINLATAKSSLPRDALANAIALTEDQKIALSRYWKEYLEKYNTSRSVLPKSVNTLEESVASTQKTTTSNLHAAAAGFDSAAEAVAALDGFTKQELISRAELILGAWSVLRPLQHTVILFDITTKIDIVGIYKKLLRLDSNLIDSSGTEDHFVGQHIKMPATLFQG